MKKHANPIDLFTARVEAEMQRGNVDRPMAIRAVVAAHPQLHAQYLVAVNDKAGRSRAKKQAPQIAGTAGPS